jgi:hypothetical protein
MDAASMGTVPIGTTSLGAVWSTGAVPMRHATATIVVKRFDSDRRRNVELRAILAFEA